MVYGGDIAKFVLAPRRIIWSGALFLLLACIRDPVDRAEALISGHDYAAALAILGGARTDSTNAEAARLRAMALLVEERAAEGFVELARFRRLEQDGAHAAAKVLLRAATAIAREKERAAEVILLLDSLMTLDPSLRESATSLAWQRGIEYLGLSGDAGFRLMGYAAGLDPDVLARLRGRDAALARRYVEMVAVEKTLPRYSEVGRLFFAANGRFPESLQEVLLAYPEEGLVGRAGWEIRFGGRQGRLAAEAHAALGNPWGIPRGTVLVGG